MFILAFAGPCGGFAGRIFPLFLSGGRMRLPDILFAGNIQSIVAKAVLAWNVAHERRWST
jgi:hypothetical protein